MKVLLTGAKGQLGQSIFKLKPEGVNLITPDKSLFDLSDCGTFDHFFSINRPNWIINCGAYTNVDNAEIEKEKAMLINAIALKELSMVSLKYGTKILHLSTDFVFNGNQNVAYSPNQKRAPLNFYGLSKAKGEEYLEDYLGYKDKAIILRTSWVMSSSGNNFATKMIKLMRDKKELNIVSDQIGCPTSVNTLGETCWKILKNEERIFDLNKNKVPILHFSDGGLASWYDVAIELRNIFIDLKMIDNPAKIFPIESKYYSSLAKRPRFSLLNCELIRDILDLPYIHWKDSLRKIFYSE